MADNANSENQEATGVSEQQGNPEVEKLRTRAQRFEAESTDLKKQLARFKGIDPEKYKALQEELDIIQREKAEKDPAEADKRWQRKEQELRSQYGSEVEELKKELGQLRATNKTLQVTDKVMLDIGGLFNDDARRFIKKEVESACDFEDGEIVVKDENGNVRYNERGTPMTPKEYGAWLAKEYPSLAKPTGVGGTKQEGTRVATRSSGAKTFAEISRLPRSQVDEAYRALSPDEKKQYLRDMRAAERGR
jgi:hypothetical protein